MSKVSYFLISSALIAALMGVLLIFVVQQVNNKVYEYSADQGSHGKRFQDSLSRLCSPVLLIGLGLIGGGCALGFLAFRLDSSQGEAKLRQVDELLSMIEGDRTQSQVPGDSMKRLCESINRLNLEVIEARKRERAVIERAVDVICITDIESRFVNVSRACISAWGYTPQELEKRPLMDILVSDNAEAILGSILGSSKSIDKIVFECKLRRKNGELMDVVWTGHWSASDGGLFCIVHDITERKKAEELVRKSESNLRSILEGLPAGVLIVGKSGKIEFANSASQHMLAAQGLQLANRSADSLIANQNSPEISAGEETAALPDRARKVATAYRLDGSSFPVDLSVSKVEIGDETKTISVFLDRTKEEELEQMKREFIAMVTHDIRTPLASVAGILALLEEGVLGHLTGQGQDVTRRVKSTCQRLLRLINDLLDLEKMHAGKFALECKNTSMKHAITQAVETVLPLADERRIKIVLEVPELDCFADEDRLIQVLVNLLSNAIKYSPDDAHIYVSLEDSGDMVKVLVKDQGRGIPSDKLEKVFSQFEQVEIADAKKRGGTGLGLAICQAIVSEHGGKIGVESVLGEGSIFWFSLPKKAEGVV